MRCLRRTPKPQGLIRVAAKKRGVKRVDRLLGNRVLHRERLSAYQRLAALTVASTEPPIGQVKP